MLATLFAIACVFLSNWQFSRRNEAVDRINFVIANYDQAPIPINELVVNGQFKPEIEWRPVTVVGHYLEQPFLVRNRPYSGSPGFIQLALFQATDGKIYAIDRGWLPTGSNQDSPDLNPPLPTGDLTITARIRPTEAKTNRDAPAGQLANINSLEMAERLGIEKNVADQVYLRMSAESTKVTSYPAQMAKPKLDEGNHLSYAIQWIVFGLMAFAALIWAIQQERLALRAATDPNFVRKARKKIGDEDKAYEDAL